MFHNHWAFIGGATAAVLAAAYVFWGPPKPRKRKGFPGLHNFGNSCFLNVILQSWAACPSLLRWLGSKAKAQQEGSLTAAVYKVLKVLNNASEEPQPDVYSPGNVLTAMERKGWIISPGQQDCHELMHALSETLDEEACPAPKVLSLFDVTALQESRSAQLKARTRITSNLPVLPRRQESPLHGLLASQISCISCENHCPVKYDVFDCLTVSMPQYSLLGEMDLESLLTSYVSPEVIENAHCPNCAKQRSAGKDGSRRSIKRTLTIGKLPQCLSMHIQRLQMANDGMPIKRQEHVSFPETLEMDPFLYNMAGSHILAKQGLCGGKKATSYRSSAAVNLLRALNYDASVARNGLFLRPPSPLLLPSSMADVNHNGPASLPDVNHNSSGLVTSQKKGHYIYRLTAVISHLGNVESGHFVTYRRGPLRAKSEQEQQMADSWWLASDCSVERVPLSHVLASQAYMLFYERA
ncbi:ubiquitin carboxyl-terminal hydrolase 30-like [Littorina saxatilis]|uniref:Ubiquitin carboxyl-terminal hydrolase n=1 Tax=Littorina saxatilis TaxID=31220 RepID=A0AAN9AIU4_9CAEN